MSEIVISSGVSYSGSSKSVMSVVKALAKASDPTPTTPKPGSDTNTSDWIHWGDQDVYPEDVMKKIKGTTLIRPILNWKKRALYGSGIVYGKWTIQNGKRVFEPIIDNEIDRWLEDTDVKNYLLEAAEYLYYFNNIFPELTFSNNGKRVNFIQVLETMDCRYKKPGKDGKINELWFNATIREDGQGKMGDKNTSKLPILDIRKNPIEAAKSLKDRNVIFPVNGGSVGKYYYQDCDWHDILDTWVPVAKAIPKFKAQLMQNRIDIRYIIHMPEWYLAERYPKWSTYDDKKRDQLLKSEHDRVQKFLTDEAKAGGSMMVKAKDQIKGMKEYSEWNIEAVQINHKDGEYIEDSQEADAHIFKNLQVDPTLFGSGPGKNTTSSGSGSDKRVAWNNYVLMNKPYQDIILKPLQFIARYNGWADKLAKEGEKFEFMFENYRIAKLDSGNEVESSTSASNE